MDGHSAENFRLKFDRQLYHYWKNVGCRLFQFARIDCSGLDKIADHEPAILTPNHLNWKDILLTAVMIRRPISFAASFKLFDKQACYKLLEQYFRAYAHYPALKSALRRFINYLAHFLTDRIRQLGTIPAKLDLHGNNFIEMVARAFQQDKLVCIFPEGGIASPGRLRRFKLGVAKILYDYYLKHHQSIPAYPVGIIGTHQFLHPGMEVGFHVGSPLYIEEFVQSSERQTLAAFINELQAAVYKLIREQK